MDLSQKGAAFVRLHEDFRAKAYKDPTGTLTIGIGFTWASAAFRDWWAKNKPGQPFGLASRMTEAEAEDALRHTFDAEYGKAVNRFLAGTPSVPQHVFDAMASVTFNAGPGALKWKWAAAAKRGDFAEAARLLTTTATTSKGKKLPGLVRRRKEEALLLEKGIYTGVGAAPAPARKPINLAPADEPASVYTSVAMVKVVQRKLTDLGYPLGSIDPKTGDFDGKPGKLTGDAIAAFRADNGLPISRVIDGDLVSALDTAKPRKLPRVDTKAEEIAKTIPEVRTNLWNRLIAAIVGVPAGAAALVDGTLGNLSGARGYIEPLKGLADDVPGWIWLGGVALVAAGIYFVAKHGQKAGVQAFREGARL